MNAQQNDLEDGMRQRRHRWLYRYACLMVGATLILIGAGGMVTSTGSGLSVPDWPNTYGHNMFAFPYSEWVGGIFYEHGHRLIASTVGFLTIILAIWLHVARPTPLLKKLGWAALGAVILQGILGGMTVLFLLPTWISVFHACLAQTYLCILMTIVVGLAIHLRSASNQTRPFDRPSRARLSRWSFGLVVVVFAQLIAGAIMRHTHSGLAVPDFPTTYGAIVPDLSASAIGEFNEIRAFDYQLEPVSHAQVLYHMAHRFGAVIVVIAVLVIGTRVLMARNADVRLKRAVGLIATLVLFQAGLGIATVLMLKPPVIATGHVVVGAATLAASWRLYLYSRQVSRATSLEDRTQSTPIGGLVSGAVA